MKITEVAKVVSGPNPHHMDTRKIYESLHAMEVVITLQHGEAGEKQMSRTDILMSAIRLWLKKTQSTRYYFIKICAPVFRIFLSTHPGNLRARFPKNFCKNH